MTQTATNSDARLLRAGAIRKSLRALWATAVAVLAIAAVRATVGLGSDAAEQSFDLWVAPLVYAAPAAIVALRAVTVRRERAGWAAMAVAFVLWLCWYVSFAVLNATHDTLPYPSVADGFWLAFYPVAYFGLVQLARGRVPTLSSRTLWVDGMIGTLALGSVGAAILVGPILDSGDTAAVATTLAYPLGDLLLLSAVLTTFASSGWRPGRSWTIIGGAFLLEIVVDFAYVLQVATGTYQPGTALDLGWPCMAMIVAWAAWQHDHQRALPVNDNNWRLLTAPLAFTLAAATVLVYDRVQPTNVVAFALALATLVAGFARAATSFAEARTMEVREHLLARHGSILDAAREGIFGIGPDGRVTFVNPAGAALSGRSREDLIGATTTGLLDMAAGDAPHTPLAEDLVAATLRDGIARHAPDGVCRRKDGTTVAVEYSVTPLYERSQLSGAVLVIRDITERREVERVKAEFTAVVSHELRTPLTSIRGSLGLLAGGALGVLPERAQRMVEIASGSTERLVRLINDILDIERIESGTVALEQEECEARDLITSTVDALRPMAQEAGVTLEVETEPVRLWADPDRVIQTLTNLVSNALKFSPRGGTVTVSLGRENGQAIFTVADQGRGIPADQLELIFERFQQVDTSDARDKGGTGLGLAICRTLVQQHGGRIWVESVEGAGSSFHFTLPALNAGTGSGPDIVRDQDPIILVCDDDTATRHVLSEMLHEQGYRIIGAASGEEALRLAAAEQPAVILLDLLMPRLSGWQTAEMLRQSPETRDIPVVILSVLSASDTQAPSVPIAGWVEKPVAESSLTRALENAIALSRPVSRVLVIEDDINLARVLAGILERPDLQVVQAHSGQSAVAACTEQRPDLIVLDLMLPDGDGFEVVDVLRGHADSRNLPMVVYTAKDLNPTDRERLRLGPTEFLNKGSFAPEDLQQRVRDLLAAVTRPDRLTAPRSTSVSPRQ